jgi:coenzyme F420-dependent glucose-6-phosphate dehydrogenase
MRYWAQLATEQFPPSELVDQAIEAERAGFDGLNVSDHFQPWWEPGHSGQAWVLLGAIGHATERVAVGTGVTAPVHRYHPAVVAQLGATLQELFPGRGFLGIGSGEALNETPAGMDWPDTAEQVRRMEEALEIIDRLLAGERLDADPDSAPDLIDAYRSACEDAGREAGEIILQTGFSWAPDDDAALEGARVWKATQPEEFFTDDWHDPKAMYEKAEGEVSDEEFKQSYIIGSDPELHVERIREVEQLGATVVCLQNGSGADPLGALRTYAEHVLPALRGARV